MSSACKAVASYSPQQLPFEVTKMKLTLLALVILLQTLFAFPNEYAVNEATTAPINVNPLDTPTQITEFLNDSTPIAEATASAPLSPGTICKCAFFNSKTSDETDNPIVTQALIHLNCDNTGEDCLNLCSVLAQAAEEHAPHLFCSRLAHCNKFTASVHNRFCGAIKWTYIGLISPYKICCHENKVIDCKDQVADPDNPPPNQL